MLRFNWNLLFIILLPFWISIHLMLRFNIFIRCHRGNDIHISIHLMLRFNLTFESMFYVYKEFQYILCYGSTRMEIQNHQLILNFNTSYVTVQPLCFWDKIKLLINFNTSYVTVQRCYTWCYQNLYKISIHLMLRFNVYTISVDYMA